MDINSNLFGAVAINLKYENFEDSFNHIFLHRISIVYNNLLNK